MNNETKNYKGKIEKSKAFPGEDGIIVDETESHEHQVEPTDRESVEQRLLDLVSKGQDGRDGGERSVEATDQQIQTAHSSF